jgi:hypothetical protein
MKLVTAISTAALVLAPAVGLAQAPENGAGDTKDEPSLKSKVQQMIGIGSPEVLTQRAALPRRAQAIQTTPIGERSRGPINSAECPGGVQTFVRPAPSAGRGG